MISLLFLSLAAIDAPVTQVTVFTDQARVVRTAQLAVNGSQKLEFPALKDSVDVASVRVEAQGAEVKRVDIERIAPEALRTDEAKKLLAELDRVDAELDRLDQERVALSAQRDALLKIAPRVPDGEPLKPSPKLNAGGWAQAASFSAAELGKVQGKLRDGERARKKLTDQRNALLEKARLLGNPQTTSGWKVLAQVSGNGPATLTLTYLVRGAQWTPTWDLQLQPDTNMVNLSLAGLVSQSSGEDWAQATLFLSTAIPMQAVQVPKLATWKIGVADRFIPTPRPISSPIAPPPPVRPLQQARSEEDLVRARLQRLGVAATPAAKGLADKRATIDFSGENIDGDLAQPEEEEFDEAYSSSVKRPASVPPPPPQAPRSYDSVSESSVQSAPGSLFAKKEAYVPTTSYSLSPPPSWRPPRYGADSPVTLAEGYDLSFTSLQKETIPSARGARRVALWSAQWPVQVERKLFPAITTDAYLVAELKNPSQQVLPGGPAQLFVGADPAGTARLKLVSPGESFVLPLGIDRALKPVRNVKMVEATQGVISKDEVGTYTVTIELANPYRSPVAVRVADQWPVTEQKELETKLLDTKPTAIQDQKRGGLEWRVTIPPQQKQVFTFTYSVKRPKNWKLQQQEVVR